MFSETTIQRMSWMIIAVTLTLILFVSTGLAGSKDSNAGTNAADDSSEIQTAIYAPDQLVVKLISDTLASEYLDDRYGFTMTAPVTRSGAFLVSASSDVDLATAIEEIGDDPNVEYVHPNYLVSRLHPVQGSYPFSDKDLVGSYEDQPSAGTLELDASHQLSTGSGVTVAVIDGGVDFDHPTVAGSVVSGFDYIDQDYYAFDEPGGINSGHGTFVAGIILLTAPDVLIKAYRVTTAAGVGDGYSLALAIEQAVWDGCDVINLSLVLTGEHLAVRDAITYAENQGVVVVSAAGNEGNDIPLYPAADGRTLAVAALDSLNVLAEFSSYGDHIDVCAPGTDVYSAYVEDGFAWWSGTSFSTPFVTAQAALLRELKPLATPASIRAAVVTTADNLDDLNPDLSGLLGNGLIRPTLSQIWIADTATAQVMPDTLHFVHEFGTVYWAAPGAYASITSTNQPVAFAIEVPDNDRFIEVSDSTGMTPDSIEVLLWSLDKPPGVFYDTVLFHVAGVDDPIELTVELTVTPPDSMDYAYVNPAYLKFTANMATDPIMSKRVYLTSSNAPAQYTASVLPNGGGFAYVIDSVGMVPDSVAVYVDPSLPFSPGIYFDTVVFDVEGVDQPAYLTIELELFGDTIVTSDTAWLDQSSARYFTMIENTYTVLSGCIDVMSSNAPATYIASFVGNTEFAQWLDSTGTTNGTTCFSIPNPGLPVGTYVDTISFYVEGVSNNPLIAPIVLSIVSDTSTVPLERVRMVIETETGPGGQGASGGDMVDVSIHYPDSGSAVYPIGGFDFLVGWDSEALFMIQALPGGFMQDCEWEYFNYRVDSGLTAPFPSGLTRVVALADINNGSTVRPDCYATVGVSTELAVLQFVVKYDIPEDSLITPIRFYWQDCGDNVVSSVMGDTLLISHQVYDYDGGRIDFPGAVMPGINGASLTCDADINIRAVDFFNGGVLLHSDTVITSDSIWVEPREIYLSAPGGQVTAQWSSFLVRSDGQAVPYFAWQRYPADFITYFDSTGMSNDSLVFMATTTAEMAPGWYEDTIFIEPFDTSIASTYAVVYMMIDSGSVEPTVGAQIVIETETGSEGLGVQAKDTVDVTIWCSDSSFIGYPMGGYDFLMSYDTEMLTLLDVTPGIFMVDCEWEYFSFQVDSGLAPPSPSGLVRVVAVADLADGPTTHPSCFVSGVTFTEMAVMKFQVTDTLLDDCLFTPIRFYWQNCGNNVISSIMGDSLLISDEVYDYNGHRLDDPGFGMPGWNGADSSCDAPNNVRAVDFFNGGVKLWCPDNPADDSLYIVPRYVYLTAPEGQQTVQWASFLVMTTGQPVPYSAWQFDQPDFTLVFDSTGMTGDSLLVQITTGSEMVAGIYEDTIIVEVDSAFNSPEFIVIRMTIEEGGGSGCDSVVAMPSALYFTMAWNEYHKSGTVTIYACSDTVPWVGYVAGGDGSFVSLPDTGGITGEPIQIDLDRPTEFAGAYSDTVVFYVYGYEEWVLVPVNLVVMDTVSSIVVSAAPNPFNPTLRISFALPDPAEVKLEIYNVLGRRVTTLAEGRYGAGHHEVFWHGADQASGVYFYRLQADDFVLTRKVVLLK